MNGVLRPFIWYIAGFTYIFPDEFDVKEHPTKAFGYYHRSGKMRVLLKLLRLWYSKVRYIFVYVFQLVDS